MTTVDYEQLIRDLHSMVTGWRAAATTLPPGVITDDKAASWKRALETCAEQVELTIADNTEEE